VPLHNGNRNFRIGQAKIAEKLLLDKLKQEKGKFGQNGVHSEYRKDGKRIFQEWSDVFRAVRCSFYLLARLLQVDLWW